MFAGAGTRPCRRVLDRGRASIVGEGIKGTLIVAAGEQWRHRNYRYTPGSRAASAQLGAILIYRYISRVHVRVHTRKGGTRRVLRVATRVRTCVHARTLDPPECRPANARVHASGAIPAMRNVSSRTSTRVRKNGRLVSFFFFVFPGPLRAQG